MSTRGIYRDRQVAEIEGGRAAIVLERSTGWTPTSLNVYSAEGELLVYSGIDRGRGTIGHAFAVAVAEAIGYVPKPSDPEPPTEPEPLAEWERELLAVPGPTTYTEADLLTALDLTLDLSQSDFRRVLKALALIQKGNR